MLWIKCGIEVKSPCYQMKERVLQFSFLFKNWLRYQKNFDVLPIYGEVSYLLITLLLIQFYNSLQFKFCLILLR